MELTSPTSSGQYLLGPGDLRTEDRSIAPPLADEVQIAVRATTLCGSDIHYYQHYRNGSIQVREPLCLGHEAAGEVVAVGESVSLRVGERIAIECGVPCEDCKWCRAKRYNLCPKLRFRSSGSAWPHFQGTLQTRINHPARWCHRWVIQCTFSECPTADRQIGCQRACHSKREHFLSHFLLLSTHAGGWQSSPEPAAPSSALAR